MLETNKDERQDPKENNGYKYVCECTQKCKNGYIKR